MNNTQIIRQYEAPISQRQQNLFLEEYYCGTDTRIYIDNDEQTEISGISYNISEQLKPLYGYASRTWDDVAVGTRIVTGVLKIPIRNPIENTKEEEYMTVDEETTQDIIDRNNEKDKKEKEKLEWPDGLEHTSVTGDTVDVPEEDPGFISKWQKKLKKLGYDVEITGKHDKATKKAINKYQKDKGFPKTGYFDEQTTKSLKADTTSKQVRIYSNTYGHAEPDRNSDKLCYIPADAVCSFIAETESYYNVQYMDDGIPYNVFVSKQYAGLEG